jgi:putrescine importer
VSETVGGAAGSAGRSGKKLLTLTDLVFFGIVLIQPIAPVPLYGVAQKLSGGYLTTIILFAMFAMMITAVSYGRMAALFPSAGSAYTYVGKGINPHLGFLAGWAMFLDYLLLPLINCVWIAAAMHNVYTPKVPFAVWAAIVAGVITLLNLQGIRSSARQNQILLFGMFIVIGFFIVLALRYLFVGQGWGGIFSTQPFYDPATWNMRQVLGATSFAALTYIGFDGVTTLTEDAENPKRNILLATVIVCVFTGLFGGLEVYLAQRVWPEWQTFKSLETAFMDVSGRVGGPVLFNAMGVVVIVAAFGSGLGGGLGAAKLLFGMGRDNVLPRKFFGHVKTGTSTPTYNILLIGLLSFVGAVLLNFNGSAYQQAGELLNFGAFLSFMGVNAAAFYQFGILQKGGPRKIFIDIVLPVIGFIFCTVIWWNLNPLAKTLGGIWFAVGAIYLAVKTNFFRNAPATIDFSEG